MVTDAERWERERLVEALDAHKRGLSDAPYIRKWFLKSGLSTPLPAGTSESSHDPVGSEMGSAEMTFVVSTDEVDRHGDLVSVGGWRLQAYRRNPVFLWAHDYTQPAIGRALAVWKEGHSLQARIQFAPTDFAQEVARLYQGGYQSGVSVGFRPIQYEIRRDPRTGESVGIVFLEQELLEISAAPVPANENALRKALDAAPRMRSYYRRAGFVGGAESEDALPPRFRTYAGQGGVGGPAPVPWERALAEILDALRYAG